MILKLAVGDGGISWLSLMMTGLNDEVYCPDPPATGMVGGLCVMERANKLPNLYCHRYLKSQAAPSVIDGYDLSGNGLSGGVAVFLQEFTG